MAADTRFKFLSVFKWEARKGWDVLLRAYFEEFQQSDPVCLYIRTYAYHSNSNFEEMMADFARSKLGKEVAANHPLGALTLCKVGNSAQLCCAIAIGASLA